MSSSRKRKNPNHNTELPAAKRVKTSKSDSEEDEEEPSKFRFETAKPCDKIVALGSKRQRLKLQNREQCIRIRQKQKEIELLQSRLQRLSQRYEPYHRLLVTFANAFDQIFVTLQQNINPTHSLPLSQTAMKMLIEGIRVHETNDDHTAADAHKHQHFKHQLDDVYSMLQSRSNAVIEFLRYIESQIHDATANGANLKYYIESIKHQMDEYWKLSKDVRHKYDKDTLLSDQQLILQENWDLAMHYKGLLRHYKYITKYPKSVQHDTDYDLSTANGTDTNTNNNNNSTTEQPPAASTKLNGTTNTNATDNNDSNHNHNAPVSNGNVSANDSTERAEENEDNHEQKTMQEKHATPEGVTKIEEEELDCMKKEMESLREKCNKQTDEIYALRDKLEECDKSVSHYKAKYENYLRQINEQNTMEQGDEMEKNFMKNLNEFSFVLQEEYRQTLQKQAKDKEEALKLQIDSLNKALSQTKNKLFQAQVKCVKSRAVKKPQSSSSGKAAPNKGDSKEKEKQKEDRKRSKRSSKDKKEHKDRERTKRKEKSSSKSSRDKESDKEKDQENEKGHENARASRSRSRDRETARSRTPSSSHSKSRSRSRSRSRAKHNKSSDRDKASSKRGEKDSKKASSRKSSKSSSRRTSGNHGTSTDDEKDRKKEHRKKDSKQEKEKEKDNQDQSNTTKAGKSTKKEDKERDDETVDDADADEEDNDYDSDNINEKNEVCMESVNEFVCKQLQEEIARNVELQALVQEMKESQVQNDSDSEHKAVAKQESAIKQEHKEETNKNNNSGSPSNDDQAKLDKMRLENEALRKQIDDLSKQSKKTVKLNMKLQILKEEYNKSLKQVRENVEARNKEKDVWCGEMTKLKEQNEFLVSSNHKNRAELKRMNEEKKLLMAKFELYEKQKEVLEKQIAEKENENQLVKKMEEEHSNEMKVRQQSNSLLKETTKKLYQQIQGIKAELLSRTDDYNEKMKKYQELSKKLEVVIEEKAKLSAKLKTLNAKIAKLESVNKRMISNSNEGNNGQTTDEKIKILNHLLQTKKQKLNCAVCKEREKKVLLSKCLHMFCRECIKQQKTARNRSCPLCKKKFDPNSDVKPVTF